MTDQEATARRCLEGAENDTMTFPGIVGSLIAAGFDWYSMDFRRAAATYYLHSGKPIDLATHAHANHVATAFDEGAISGAIAEAQQQVEGYTYRGFCRKVMDAGCSGYLVSFLGRRALYYGRTGETHTELFPVES